MDIIDVSKGLHICIKKMDAFHKLMDKLTRTLVAARCKGVNLILHWLILSALDSWEEVKTTAQVKI